MSRATRLLALLEHMRARRVPVTAAELARDLGTSIRTIYRDIATLQGQGAAIEGEAGVGYVLRDGYFLPPLNFTGDEADALLLGLALVQERGGGDLAAAARIAKGKIEAALPAPATPAAEPAIGVVLVGRTPSHVIDTLRTAIRTEHKVRFAYRDARGAESLRTVWPLLIGLFEATETLAAWCETRSDYRHFRLDRIVTLETTAERLPGVDAPCSPNGGYAKGSTRAIDTMTADRN